MINKRINKTVSLFLAFFLLYPFSIFGEEKKSDQKRSAEEKSKVEKKKDKPIKKNDPFFKAVLKDEARILTSPFRINGSEWLIWGGIALVTGILIAYDEPIYRGFKDFQKKNSWVDDISPHITKLGDGGVNLGIAGAFFLGGLLFKNKNARETARLALMTFIHTGIVVQLGKHLTGRRRPYINDEYEVGIDHWYGLQGFFKRYSEPQAKYDAFPSGHTISIWGTATVIAEMYKKTVVVPILCYSLATLTGLSRITEDTHWISDVFLGAVLGFAIGKFVVKTRNRLGKINVVPFAGSQKIGVTFSYTF